VVREVDAELSQYEVDDAATEAEREGIRSQRHGWLEEDPEAVAERYRSGEVDLLDVLRRHGVILDWGTGELLPQTTEQFREMLRRRASSHWGGAGRRRGGLSAAPRPAAPA
jgi:N-methylhydantoinase B